MMISSLQLWRDRKGRLSGLRIGTLALLVWPILWAAYEAAQHGLGGRPLNNLIHRAGYWALIFLLLSLAVTPLRRSARFAKLVDVRRMIGVASFLYAALHLALYVVDQQFNLLHVASEIVRRLYLTIGFVAFLGLAVLAATSNDTMTRRLGGLRWRRLHQITYAITLLALIHFFQQTKADVTLPTLFAGLFGWLMGYRLMDRFWSAGREPTPAELAGLAIVTSLLTFAGEAIGIGIAFGVSPMRVLETAFEFDFTIRPGWYVLGAGLAVALIDLVRRQQTRRPAKLPPANLPPVPAGDPAGPAGLRRVRSASPSR